MKIVGIHDGHNGSAALLENGNVTFAIEEERLTRIKNDATFPFKSLDLLFKYTATRPEEIDNMVFSSVHMPANKTRNELLDEYRHSSSVSSYPRRLAKKTALYSYMVNKRRKERIANAIKCGFQENQILFQDHHTSHAATAYFGCPWWKDEKVLVLTNDGGGDGLCATVSIGDRGNIERIATVSVADSIGYLYSMITFILGMVPEEHEYKLMGMSPYASEDNRSDSLKEVFASLFNFREEDKGLSWTRARGCPPLQHSYNYLNKIVRLQRFDLVCRALQDFTEEFLADWVRNCIAATGINKVAMSGGVFMNVKANKRIMELPEVESLFIFPTCGDVTNSIGAAYKVFAESSSKANQELSIAPLKGLYWGPSYTDDEIKSSLDESGVDYEICDCIEKDVAELLYRGEVVARFAGRMEFGARALGNRSILANPANRDVIRTINEMIKNRDFWMPFAPSILEDEVEKVLVNPKNIQSSYMIMSFDSNIGTDQIYAACHPYDGTMRPQVVHQDWNPSYYKLIKYFKNLSGLGVVLNTSFNLHGFPIVCQPDDAIDVFKKSGLTYMAIGNFLVRKKTTSSFENIVVGDLAHLCN